MKILITAGPTREPIDAVRFVGNRSSGKTGVALARAALGAGHRVVLLLGPCACNPPMGCETYRFESTAELKQLLEAQFGDCDVLLMAAAVADYRPTLVAEGKLPRGENGPLTLVLDPTPDLVRLAASQKRANQRVIAFALEERDQLELRASAKLKKKDVDAIVACPLGTMESDSITPLWLTAAGERESPGRMSKEDFAKWLVARAEAMANI